MAQNIQSLYSCQLLFSIWQLVVVLVLYHLSFPSNHYIFFLLNHLSQTRRRWKLHIGTWQSGNKHINLASFFLRLHGISVGLQSIELKYYCWSTLMVFVKIAKCIFTRVSWNNYKTIKHDFPRFKDL